MKYNTYVKSKLQSMMFCQQISMHTISTVNITCDWFVWRWNTDSENIPWTLATAFLVRPVMPNSLYLAESALVSRFLFTIPHFLLDLQLNNNFYLRGRLLIAVGLRTVN